MDPGWYESGSENPKNINVLPKKNGSVMESSLFITCPTDESAPRCKNVLSLVQNVAVQKITLYVQC